MICIKIRLDSGDHKNLIKVATDIVNILDKNKIKTLGPMVMPNKNKEVPAPKSPQIYKDSMQLFFLSSHCIVIIVLDITKTQQLQCLAQVPTPKSVYITMKPHVLKRKRNKM